MKEKNFKDNQNKNLSKKLRKVFLILALKFGIQKNISLKNNKQKQELMRLVKIIHPDIQDLCKLAKKQNKLINQYNLKSECRIEYYKKFAQKLNDINAIEKYKKLIKGLDKNSINCICLTLARIQKIANLNSKSIDIFTDEEKKQLAILQKEYKSSIVELFEDCYAYKQYMLPIKHFESSVFYYKHGMHLINDIEKIKDKSIIDVGAYIGDSAILFESYTNKNVYAFEPTTKNYEYMLKTIELNESSNIVPIKKALGEREETLEIFLQDSESSINSIVKKNPAKETIQVTSLDKFIDENKVEVGLIKVDIEGFEQNFLKGAFKTIKEQKPVLLISIYHSADDFFNIKPMIESWNLNYEFKIYKPTDGRIRGEILLIAQQKET